MVSNRALRRLFLGVLGSGCVQLVAALSDAPTVTNYLRKGQTSATLLGNYIYMDGGEISQLTNGNINLKDRLSNQVNSTISVDLSTSWTTSNVVLRTIPKTGPIKNNVVLWTDSSANTFYSWGGKWSWGKNMADTQLWKFVADGSGGGTWSVQDPANPSLFNNLIPAESGAFTTVNDTGFMIGGVASGWTEKNRLKNQAIPGMLAFNMKTKTWYNGTFAFSPFESLSGASAHYIPSFGPSGLVMVMGGHAPSVDTEPQISISPFFDLGNVTLFDPQTKKTYSQKTTGDVPPSPRSGFCTAGFKNTDGGYEIFVYGGENQRDLFYYDDGYILSLPGFVWTKVPQSTAGPRGYHSCLSIGNRQVLSIGGVNGSWIDKDPAPQGLQLFDMTSLAWKDTYDANAASYEAPEVIKKLYSNGALEKVQWSSAELRDMFINAAVAPPGTTTSNNTSSGTPVGAIAGGVVGGLAAVALIAAAVWMIWRRHQKAKNSTPKAELGANEDIYPYSQAPGGEGLKPPPISEAGDTSTISELPNPEGISRYSELPNSEGISRYSELSSNTAKAEKVEPSVQVPPAELDGSDGR